MCRKISTILFYRTQCTVIFGILPAFLDNPQLRILKKKNKITRFGIYPHIIRSNLNIKQILGTSNEVTCKPCDLVSLTIVLMAINSKILHVNLS